MASRAAGDAAGKEGPGPAASDAGSSAAMRGASLLILLQLVSRAITFVANQVLLRFLTAQLLGVSTQLEVYYLSVVFFARESLRVAVQRQGLDAAPANESTPTTTPSRHQASPVNHSASARASQAVVNLAYLAILLGIPLALVFGRMYASSLSAETLAATPNLMLSLRLYGLAAVLELLSEPVFMLVATRLQFATRAAAESIATFLRCAVALGTAVWGGRRGVEPGVLPFALGQLSYGAGLLAVYLFYGLRMARSQAFSLAPKKLALDYSPPSGSAATATTLTAQDLILGYFYRPTLQLATSMTAQSVVKHVLTQGDTLLASTLATPTAQGVYALANNYGGLAARLLFQPIEESSRSYFSRLLATSPPAPDSKPAADPKSSPSDLHSSQHPAGDEMADVAGKPEAGAHTPTLASHDAASKAASDLQALFKAYTLFSLVVVTVGPSAAPLLLSLVAGPRWASSGAGACLAAYAWYVPLLALNGVAEAFVASVASEGELHHQSAFMTVFSLAFAAAGFISLRVMDLGAVGLVLANVVNMLCRIAWCTVYILNYFSRTGTLFDLVEIVPAPAVVLAAVVTSQAVSKLARPSLDSTSSGIVQLLLGLAKIAAASLPFVAFL